MITIKIKDQYNKSKVWIIRRYDSGHYYLNQEICNSRFYRRNSRTTVKHLSEVLNIRKQDIHKLFKLKSLAFAN